MLDRLRVRRRPRAGAAAQAPDRARGHRRRRRLPRLRRRARDHRRRLQRRRGPRPVSSFMAVDPSTGHEFAELPETSPEQVAEMVEDAHRALDVEHDWRTPLVRAQALTRLARRIEAEERVLCRARDARHRQAAHAVQGRRRRDRPLPRVLRRLDRAPRGPPDPARPRRRSTTRCASRGACAAQIIPWNYPLQVTARCAAPALAAGNAVILKPSELASMTPLRLRRVRRGARACRAG